MATIQEQLQIKRSPIDVWDVREKLLLASSVSRNGDQNWMTVSRLMKSYGYPTRPSDWYSQKNCAAQYGLLLEHVETPKRKKRVAGADTIVETPSESIIRRLRDERMVELEKFMVEEKKMYLKLTEEIFNVRTGRANEVQLKEMCLEIEQEKKRKEKEAKEEAERMRQREEKKLELERQWRPFKIMPTGQKRKLSETIDTSNESVPDTITEVGQQEQKPAMSPLLTSLLKSPTPTSTSSLLHSAITSNAQNSSPTIASLLNSSADVTVSAGILHLVTSAISNEPVMTPASQTTQNTNTGLPKSNIRILDNIFDVKKEPVQSVISDEEIQLIEEVLKDVEESESKVLSERKEDIRVSADESKIGEIKNELNKATSKTISNNQITESKMVIPPEDTKDEIKEDTTEVKDTEKSEDSTQKSTIREVSIVLEGLEHSMITSEKNKESEMTNKPLIEEVKVEDIKDEVSNESTDIEETPIVDSKEIDQEPEQDISNIASSSVTDTKQEMVASKEDLETPIEISDSNEIKIESESIDDPSKTPTLNEPDFDDLAISVIKNEKNKRDYSRNKKKELAFLLSDDAEEMDEIVDPESDKKLDKNKSRLDADRSESPWTEEEVEQAISKSRRRYSTPATPSDSVPNSPASSVAGFEDDRDYRAWKKSMMLFYNRLAAHKYASLFLKPITDEQAPGYHSVIREPKDLQTLRKNIDNGQVKTTQDFIRYVLLMFQNALMYNKTNEYIYNMAREMQDECIQQILTLVQAQANIETPARRETRMSEPSSKHKTEISSVTKSRKRKLE